MVICSLSGCTEKIGEIVANHLKSHNIEVKIVIPDEVTKETLDQYENILIGTYTYSTSTTGQASVPFELEDLIDLIEDSNPNKKFFGVFGSCDSSYNCYGEAIELLAFKLFSFGGKIFKNRLKIELYPETEEQLKECETYANAFLMETK